MKRLIYLTILILPFASGKAIDDTLNELSNDDFLATIKKARDDHQLDVAVGLTQVTGEGCKGRRTSLIMTTESTIREEITMDVDVLKKDDLKKLSEIAKAHKMAMTISHDVWKDGKLHKVKMIRREMMIIAEMDGEFYVKVDRVDKSIPNVVPEFKKFEMSVDTKTFDEEGQVLQGGAELFLADKVELVEYHQVPLSCLYEISRWMSELFFEMPKDQWKEMLTDYLTSDHRKYTWEVFLNDVPAEKGRDVDATLKFVDNTFILHGKKI